MSDGHGGDPELKANVSNRCSKPHRALAAGEKFLLQAIARWDQLITQHPTILEYQFNRAETLWHLAEMMLKAKRLGDCEKWALVALGHRERLLQRVPKDTTVLSDLFHSYKQMVILEFNKVNQTKDEKEQNRIGRAAADWEKKLVDLLAQHVDQTHFPPSLRTEIAKWSSDRAALLESLGDVAEALKEWDRAIQFAAPKEREKFEAERSRLRAVQKQ